MSIIAIYLNTAKGRTMSPVREVRAVTGRGLEGNRIFRPEIEPPGASFEPDREVTLIESEAVEAVNRDEKLPFELAESRRNLVTLGVALNHLIGRRFRVGEATLLGLRLCEPCAHLESLTRPGVLRAFLHRGGLRAQVLSGGSIRVGDTVQVETDS
jgi:MOSC domain-containing protein YiiM